LFVFQFNTTTIARKPPSVNGFVLVRTDHLPVATRCGTAAYKFLFIYHKLQIFKSLLKKNLCYTSKERIIDGCTHEHPRIMFCPFVVDGMAGAVKVGTITS
jgi:hypothetical protein